MSWLSELIVRLFTPKKVRLGPPLVLAFNGVFKVQVSGTGTVADPIIVSSVNTRLLKELYARQYQSFCSGGREVPEEIRGVDWRRGVPTQCFDLVIEQEVFFKAVGFSGIEWNWLSRKVLISNDRVLSLVQIRLLKTNTTASYYFDHTAFFAASGGDFGVKMSMAFTNSLNRAYSNSREILASFQAPPVTPQRPDRGASNIERLTKAGAGIVEIHAATSADAAKQIFQHLNEARADGWVPGEAHALIDGWRNEYHIAKDGQTRILAFDLRPTLIHITDTLELTIATMLVAAPPKELSATKRPASEQDAWIKQRVQELENRPATNVAAVANESAAGNIEPRSDASDLIPIAPQTVASMLLRQKQLQTEVQAGKTLSNEEQKEFVILQFLLGSPGEESLIKTQKLSLEDAKDIRAIADFTFGDIKTLLTGQGLSRGDVIRFIRDVQFGALSLEEAKQFLEDCKEWDRIKSQTDLSKEEFFAKRLAARKKAQKVDPSFN